ncbi:hypothetical protein AVEN_187930-1 [Araneus ventricosus]|uniref:Uncharacterized protein n=1 Tax=Araneus ventricosus TaxID=182803 RepID=A0A4Y2E232_ARAVE|nr:hypothetical protein AVEN_187930-1 [Araneus ventricosus]
MSGDYFKAGKTTYGFLAGRRLLFLNKAPEEGLSVSALIAGESGLYLEGYICGILCLLLVDTGTAVTLLRTVLAQKWKKELIYTVPKHSFKNCYS